MKNSLTPSSLAVKSLLTLWRPAEINTKSPPTQTFFIAAEWRPKSPAVSGYQAAVNARAVCTWTRSIATELRPEPRL